MNIEFHPNRFLTVKLNYFTRRKTACKTRGEALNIFRDTHEYLFHFFFYIVNNQPLSPEMSKYLQSNVILEIKTFYFHLTKGKSFKMLRIT